MRGHPLRLLTAAACLLAWPVASPLGGRSLADAGDAGFAPSADDAAFALWIEAPDALRSGGTRELVVRLRTPPDQDHPLLLTPSVEGSAVEVVRGRLLRADARAREPGEVRFAVPLRLREPGTAILRIEVLTYRCEARCQPIRVRASRTLVVQ